MVEENIVEKTVNPKVEKVDIASMRSKLDELNEKKEAEFQKKTELTEQIDELINQIKNLKDNRNEKVETVKEAVEDRSKLNTEIKEKIKVAKVIDEEKKKLMKQHNITEDPSKIKGMVEKLESQIETQIMSFNQETKLMKQIKELKKKMEGAQVMGEVIKQSKEISKEINELKKQAETAHKSVQNRAKMSQDEHEKLVSISNKIKELKAQRKDALHKFKTFKAEFKDLNEQFKEDLKVHREVKKDGVKKKVKRDKKPVVPAKDVAQMKEEIDDKLKKGKKLTTEDLLAYQYD